MHNMEPLSVIFIGPQGSGKGTQVELLKAHLQKEDETHNVIEVQTGAGFRTLTEGGSYTSLRIKNILEHGSLVPDFLTESVVVSQLMADMTSQSHVIFDGFPRSLHQAAFIDDLMSFYLRGTLSVVHLDTPFDIVRQRIRKRGRSDDTEASIDERLRLYREMTEPLLTHYHERPDTNFVEVDGSMTVDEVHKAIIEGLRNG